VVVDKMKLLGNISLVAMVWLIHTNGYWF